MGLRYTGEQSAYFANGRLQALAGRLRQLGEQPQVMLDFGCGTGSSTPLMNEVVGATRAIGVDVSARSLAIARARHADDDVEFYPSTDCLVHIIDCAYSNGVFHHIARTERAAAVAAVYSAIRPAGLFALCENNPWNPGTRLVMRSIPFDAGAAPLPAAEARRLLQAGGFEILSTDYLFVFPHSLRAFRRLENGLRGSPLCAQYMVLARKPSVARRERQ